MPGPRRNPAPARRRSWPPSVAHGGLLSFAAGALVLLAMAAQPPAPSDASGPYGLAQTYLNPSPHANDEFGNAVAWLPAGNKLAVSARSDLLGGSSAVGAVYILDRDSGAVTQVLSRTGAAADEYLGFSLAVSGTQVLAGAPHDNVSPATKSGAAYLFDALTGSLEQTFNNPLPNNNDFFGTSVAVVSDTAVLVGVPQFDGPVTNAGRVYLCDISSGACPTAIDIPIPAAHDGAFFGTAVVSLGSYFAVGAPLDTFQHGRVYVYSTTTETLYNSFAPTTTATGDNFGGALASVNGNVLVGAQNTTSGGKTDAGIAYLYQPNGALLHIFVNPTPETDAFFGQEVASDGTFILIGAPGASGQAGTAYLYDAASYALIGTFKKTAPVAGDEFGSALGVLGEDFLMGAPHDSQQAAGSGAVYRFGVTPANFSTSSKTVNATMVRPGALFTYTVKLSNSGSLTATYALTDTLDPRLILVSAPGLAGTSTLTASGVLAGGATLTYTIAVHSTQPLVANIANVAHLSGDGALRSLSAPIVQIGNRTLLPIVWR